MWRKAVTEAARKLQMDYTIPKKGTQLYRAARRIYDNMIMSEDEDSDEYE